MSTTKKIIFDDEARAALKRGVNTYNSNSN